MSGGKEVVSMKDKLLLESFCGDPSEVTYLALEGLFFCSWYAQYNAAKKGAIERNGRKSFLKEFCTIKLCTARQSGHTKAIARLAVKYLDKVMFFCPNQGMMEHSKRMIETQLHDKDIRCIKPYHIEFDDSVFELRTFNCTHAIVGHDVEAIIVDGTFALSEAKINALYDYPVVKFPFFYIFAE